MAYKRKFSQSIHTDTDMVENLLKYRKVSRPASIKKTPVPSVTQDDLRSVLDNFVRIYEGLDTQDVSQKPNFTYTELIFLAIMRSPNFCLPITEIYRYIETGFCYFKATSKQHWKNAIRHSLSKTKCFTKIGRKNQKPRNGVLNRSAFLWGITPKSLLTFARGDYRPTNKFSGSNALRSGFQQVNANGLWERCVLSLTHRMEAFQNILDTSPSPAKLFQLQMCNLEDTSVHFNTDSGLKDYGHSSSARGSPVTRCAMTADSSSPYSDTTSDTSVCGSDSSGYDTLEELLSPDFHMHSQLSCRVTTPIHQTRFYIETNENSSDLPELSPECMYNIPDLPEIPPLRLTFDDVIAPSDITTCTNHAFSDNLAISEPSFYPHQRAQIDMAYINHPGTSDISENSVNSYLSL
ncbi:forkhead box C1-A-like [Liolophura sinensis]|uniref:forkhead box C1-A-like n=1 Tax=Liolophura sinensis TaxID=3198878 RepID=UPI0031591D53